MTRYPMTPRGLQSLKERLENLLRVERPKNITEIETARAHGDLKENAEYKYAKNRQAEINGNIDRCKMLIGLSQVIDPASMSGDRVVFGATVEIADLDTDQELVYKIVGEHESDLKRRLISVTSPIAKGLIGKEVGDEVVVTTPKGKRKFEILEVTFTNDDPEVD